MKTASLKFAALLGVAAFAPQFILCSSSDTTAEVKECTNESLALTGGAQVSLKFKCAATYTMGPTSDADVYAYTNGQCSTTTQTLDALVPGSKRSKSEEGSKAMRSTKSEAQTQSVYTLALGPAPKEKQVFCYTCSATPAAAAATTAAEKSKKPCNIIVTVPEASSSSALESGVTPAVLAGVALLGTFAMH
ncbi:SAG-related sequence SRS11 [Toxoplasma gondii ME49]|uniref:SRS11 n=3 Tax=Toxoplasma gondii TaxID=5811 RepID=B6KP82_TOXGV|nr:SAG-related sequence SRS11 [Toxoplasma gondii ME49]EPT32363.1 SAG-related sequence SRS11 [Toxoplasma gondii ME49]ESS29478.1 SAG-related sequence SRS11 [Toxoplasma gondii VEG]KFG34966.1 SAG-related sequence SRS11 [Toxoplasma gondii GAB2-2007-GAL-DOM2]CEL71708.1 TPA: SRS11 [Toxoplasma gondii VEG]|eukprot:XP_018638469.1 SAG-related sequence SRS11 [Toxoplasma gondii ME49]